MRAGIFITARLKSTRLPMKIIKDIMGKPMIVHMLDRLKLSNRIDLIVINTSVNPQDNVLEDIAVREKVQCFRGNEEDVLLRMYDAALHYGVDTVISCTADNPFVDPEYIDKLLDYHLSQNNDYTKINGLPFGTFSYALKVDAIGKALKIKDTFDTEVWGAYFTETGLFKTGSLEVEDKFLRRPTLRLTVDYQDDFDFICKIFDGLYEKERIFTLKEILQYLDNHPELFKINMHITQKAASPIKIKKEAENIK